MAKNITNVAISDTFQVWFNKTIEIVDLINSDIITASQSGDTTIGNAILSGNFQATNITVTDILDGNIIRANEFRVPLDTTTDYIELSSQTLFSSSNQVVAILENVDGPRILARNNTATWEMGLQDASTTSSFIISTIGLATPLLSINTSGDLMINSVSATNIVSETITATTGFVGNASTATKLKNAFEIEISGAINGTISGIDGSNNLTTTTTFSDNAVANVNFRKSSGLSIVGRSANTTGNVADIIASNDHQVFRRSGTQLGFGAIALNQSNAVTGSLGVANGGTGVSSFTAGRILFGNGANPIASDSNLFWDNVNDKLGVKVSAPQYEIDVAGDIRASGLFRGTATSAQYADLAEKYLADEIYDVGTVVCVGGEKEITATNIDDLPIGVISENPAFRMNEGLEGGVFVALKGRVPVKVVGKVKKGDKLIPSFVVGHAEAVSNNSHYNIFAVALTDIENGVVEAVIL